MRKSNFVTTIVICFLCITLLSVLTSDEKKNNINHNSTTTTTTIVDNSSSGGDDIITPEEDRFIMSTFKVPEEIESGYCDESDYSAIFGLDDDIFDIHFVKNSANNSAYISNSTYDVRLYATSDGDGSSMTIISAKKIVSVLIKFGSGSGAYTLNDQSYTSVDTYHLVDDYSIVIKNVATDSKKVVIQSIIILYEN